MKKRVHNTHFLIGGISKWRNGLVKNILNNSITKNDLLKLMKREDDFFVLDVREPHGFISSKISKSSNMPLSKLFDYLDKIQRNKKKIITICSRGNRSNIASAILAKFNIKSSSLIGGISEWNKILNYEEIENANGIQIIIMAKVSKGCLSHIVCSNKEAIIIDPFYLLSYYIYLITTQKLKITNVLDTHQHADHISAARELAYVTNSKLCISRYEKYSFDANYIDDRSILNIDKKEISIIHTPGHTIGSLCVIVDMKYIFV